MLQRIEQNWKVVKHLVLECVVCVHVWVSRCVQRMHVIFPFLEDDFCFCDSHFPQPSVALFLLSSIWITRHALEYLILQASDGDCALTRWYRLQGGPSRLRSAEVKGHAWDCWATAAWWTCDVPLLWEVIFYMLQTEDLQIAHVWPVFANSKYGHLLNRSTMRSHC